FNEGLASLYEQSSIDGATITGLTNWRLPALQKAIKDDSLRSFEDLIGDDDFRNADRIGINYAQARYLMMYLQEKGLMRKYYAQFRGSNLRGDDTSGLKTLKQIIAPKELDAFEKDWKSWVLTLRFGE